MMMSTCIVTRSGSPPKAAIWSWTHCKASSWVGIGQFYLLAGWLLTWSMSPTFPAIWSSGRQRKPRGPTLYCKETSTWQIGLKSEGFGSKVKALPCHAPTASWVQPQCILPAWKTHRGCKPFGKTIDRLIFKGLILIQRMYLLNIYWSW